VAVRHDDEAQIAQLHSLFAERVVEIVHVAERARVDEDRRARLDDVDVGPAKLNERDVGAFGRLAHRARAHASERAEREGEDEPPAGLFLKPYTHAPHDTSVGATTIARRSPAMRLFAPSPVNSSPRTPRNDARRVIAQLPYDGMRVNVTRRRSPVSL